jgi:hypothetical protein
LRAWRPEYASKWGSEGKPPATRPPIRYVSPTLRHASLAPLAASLALFASGPWALRLARADNAAPGTMAVGDLRPGMKGYGLTVLSGTEPERFDIEVIGVVHQFRPNQDLVLVKTHHPRLEIVKVVGGMSGSPVFVDGKMIGAYAYGWQFGTEPVAGVTPIRSMLDDLARPLPVPRPIGMPQAGLPHPGARDVATFDASYDLFEHAKRLAGPTGRPAGASTRPDLLPIATPVLIGGVGDRAMKLARDLFDPLGLDAVQAGGAGSAQDSAAPTRFVNGGAIGVQLIRGDVSAMALGTVTRVEGDKLVAFGHPMLEGGVSALPTAVCKVLWVLASQMRSFKIGEAVRPLGALVNDRQAAIVVDSKASAPTFPLTVSIEGAPGAPHKNWSMTVAHERFLAPALVAIATGNAIDSTTSERRDVTWRATTEIAIAGRTTIKLDDAGVSVGGTPDAEEWSRSRAVRAVGALLNNPWQPLSIDRVSTTVSVKFARDVYRLRGAEVLSDVIDAGQPAKVRLHLVPYAGAEETRTVEIPVPAELAGKEVEIELSPGYQESPDLPAPENVGDLLANLPRQSYAPDSLIASIKLSSHGVALHGQVASRLPPGALDSLRPLHDTASPEPFISFVRKEIPMGRFVDGKDRVRVRVRSVLR